MTFIEWLCRPITAFRDMKQELRLLRGENKVKLANLNADIVSGKITGARLDAVTECLEAQSVNIKKKETERLR